MTWLSDAVLVHLSRVADYPDLEGTPYRIVETLGAFDYGNLYLAESNAGGNVALKVSMSSESDEGATAARLEREASVVAALNHACVARIATAGRLPDGKAFLAYQLPAGARVASLYEKGRSVLEAARLVCALCEVLERACEHGVLPDNLQRDSVRVIGPAGPFILDWGTTVSADSGTPLSGKTRWLSKLKGRHPETPAELAAVRALGRILESLVSESGAAKTPSADAGSASALSKHLVDLARSAQSLRHGDRGARIANLRKGIRAGLSKYGSST